MQHPKQNILLLGSGGRESALAWKMAQSPRLEHLYIAPGNGGTGQWGTNVALSPLDFPAVRAFCLEHDVTTIVVGPEDPLVRGIEDFFALDPVAGGLRIIGPSKEGAKLEGSKAFAKEFMARQSIPTAAYKEFSRANFEEGVQWLAEQSLPIVLKADGLAAGKGVVIAQTLEEAQEAFRGMIQESRFGKAGDKVVVEQFLDGIEMSVFALTDGKDYVLLPAAKDYKRIGEGDSGPNTGGMGAVSPVPFATDAFMQKVVAQVVEPTIAGLAKEGIRYRGFVFFGLIKVGDEPFVIEYNCRMGDPETEVVMPRLKTDLLQLFDALFDGSLAGEKVEHKAEAAATIMTVSGGYPDAYGKGFPMQVGSMPAGVIPFHAGTALENGKVVTAGGRVLALTALAPTLREALEKAYSAVGNIQFQDQYFRKDIGYEFKD